MKTHETKTKLWHCSCECEPRKLSITETDM